MADPQTGCSNWLNRHYFIKSILGLFVFILINIIFACVFYVIEQLTQARLDPNEIVLGGNSSCLREHGFMGALFHSFSLSTTIGYCRLHACTVGGRAISVVYCLACLPFTILVLKDLGYKLCVIIAGVKYFTGSKCRSCRRRGGKPASQSKHSTAKQRKNKNSTGSDIPFSTTIVHTENRHSVVQIDPPLSRPSRGELKHSLTNGYVVDSAGAGINNAAGGGGSTRNLSEISLEIGETVGGGKFAGAGVLERTKPTIFTAPHGAAFDTFVPELFCLFLVLLWFVGVAMYIHVVHTLDYPASFYYSTMFFLLREYYLADLRYTALSFLILFVGLILLSALINAIFWNINLVLRLSELDVLNDVFDDQSICSEHSDDYKASSDSKGLINNTSIRKPLHHNSSFQSNRSHDQLVRNVLTDHNLDTLLRQNGANCLRIKMISDSGKISLKRLYEACVLARNRTISSAKHHLELDTYSENDMNVSLNNQLILPSSASFVLPDQGGDHVDLTGVVNTKPVVTPNLNRQKSSERSSKHPPTAGASDSFPAVKSSKFADRHQAKTSKSLTHAEMQGRHISLDSHPTPKCTLVETSTQCELIINSANGAARGAVPIATTSTADAGVQCKPGVQNAIVNTSWINPGRHLVEALSLSSRSNQSGKNDTPSNYYSSKLKPGQSSVETMTANSNNINGHPPDPELANGGPFHKERHAGVQMKDKQVQFSKVSTDVMTSTTIDYRDRGAVWKVPVKSKDSSAQCDLNDKNNGISAGLAFDRSSPLQTGLLRRSFPAPPYFNNNRAYGNYSSANSKPTKDSSSQCGPPIPIPVHRHVSTECDLALTIASLSDTASQTPKTILTQTGSQCTDPGVVISEPRSLLKSGARRSFESRGYFERPILSGSTSTSTPLNASSTRDYGCQKIVPSFTIGSQNVPEMTNAGLQVRPLVRSKKQQFPETANTPDSEEERLNEEDEPQAETEVPERKSEGYRPPPNEFLQRKSWPINHDNRVLSPEKLKNDRPFVLRNIDRKSPFLFRN